MSSAVLTGALAAAEQMRLADRIAPSPANKSTTPLARTFPSSVGSASSSYTFNGSSPPAWLEIATGFARCPRARVYVPVTGVANSDAVREIPSKLGMFLVGLDVMSM